MKITSFRDLRVWQLSMRLVEKTYALIRSLPNYEKFGLASQIQRAVISVPSNIAEGHTREYTKEYLKFLSIAQSSLAELETQIEISYRLKYFKESDFSQILELISSLGKQLYCLRNSLFKKLAPDPRPLAPSIL